MDYKTAVTLRYIFDNKIKIHPYWCKENRHAFAELFNLDEVEMEALDSLQDFITGYGLQGLFEPEEDGETPKDKVKEARKAVFDAQQRRDAAGYKANSRSRRL